jgi:hypothetical protein
MERTLGNVRHASADTVCAPRPARDAHSTTGIVKGMQKTLRMKESSVKLDVDLLLHMCSSQIESAFTDTGKGQPSKNKVMRDEARLYKEVGSGYMCHGKEARMGTQTTNEIGNRQSDYETRGREASLSGARGCWPGRIHVQRRWCDRGVRCSRRSMRVVLQACLQVRQHRVTVTRVESARERDTQSEGERHA